MDKRDRRYRTFNVQQHNSNARMGIECHRRVLSTCRRQERLAKTEWGVIRIYLAVSIMRRPTADILKKTYRANATIITKIEPVVRSPRNPNQIPSLNLNSDNHI